MRRAAVVCLMAIGIWAIPAVAWAHAGFVSSAPEPASELSSAPGVVVLRFSEPLNRKLSRATVTTPTGTDVGGRVTGPDEISVDLSTNAIGIYEVHWTTVSLVDGHTLTGSFRFGVGVPAGPGAEGATGSSPTRADMLIAVARTIEDAALLIAVGLLVIGRLARARPALTGVRANPTIALVVATLAGLAVVLGEATSAAGGLSGSGVASYLTTGLPGTARLLRPVLELVALMVAWRGPRELVVVPLAASLIVLAAAGHAAAIEPRVLGIGVEALHLASAAVWAGGVLALAFQKPLEGWRSTAGRGLLDRFTPVALLAFAVTVTTGAIRGWEEVGSFRELFGSSYGLVLLLKVLFVALIVQFSILGWRRILVAPRWESAVVVAAVGAAALLAAFPLPPARVAEAERAEEATQNASALPGPGDLTLGGHAGEFLIGLTVRSDPGELLVFVRGLGADSATATRAVSITVDGRSVSVTQCGATCRSSPVAVRGGDDVSVAVAGDGGGQATLTIPSLSSPSADAFLAKMMRRMHALRTYRLDETLSAGRGKIRSHYAFEAPDRFTSRVVSSTSISETVWVGRTRYTRSGDGPWTSERAPPPQVPQFVWDGFQPFVDARVIGHQRIDGVANDVVAAFAGEPDLPIWFRFWIDHTGLVRRAEMRAQGHFMNHRYYDFNAPMTIHPPS